MQINIVHRFFPTNALLHKMNIAPNNLCCFCNTSEESLLHVFYECEKVKTLVQYLESKIREVDPLKHKLINNFNILIGTFNNDDKLYTLFLYFKRYIASCKSKSKLQNNLSLAWTIYKETKSSDSDLERWSFVRHIIQNHS